MKIILILLCVFGLFGCADLHVGNYKNMSIANEYKKAIDFENMGVRVNGSIASIKAGDLREPAGQFWIQYGKVVDKYGEQEAKRFLYALIKSYGCSLVLLSPSGMKFIDDDELNLLIKERGLNTRLLSAFIGDPPIANSINEIRKRGF